MPRLKAYDTSKVLVKAMFSFWKYGYDTTTVRQLEKDMGINQFSIYASFGSKHELFLKVLKNYKRYVSNTILKSLLESEGHLGDIKDFFLAFGLSVQSGEKNNGCLMVNTAMSFGQEDPEITPILMSYFKFIKETFYNTLEKAKWNKELPRDFDSQSQAEFLLVSLQGLALYAKFRKEAEIRTYIDQVLKGIQ